MRYLCNLVFSRNQDVCNAGKKCIHITHSQIWPYFISYLLTCEVDLFEVLEIMAQMWHYIISLSHKPTKVTSDFILNYLKKVIGGATTEKNLKTYIKTLISSIWMCPQGPQGCQKMCQDPLNTSFEVWCAKIASKLKNIRKSLKKQGLFDMSFSILTIFEVCAFLGQS
jgi:hypothetical protein